MSHQTHETLPSGFSYADRLQVDSFMATGSIDGAAKVALVAGAGELPRLATRLRPPYLWEADLITDYKEGWKDGKAHQRSRIDMLSVDFQDSAYLAGYLDAAENRMKWHLAHCKDHGAHDSGCWA